MKRSKFSFAVALSLAFLPALALTCRPAQAAPHCGAPDVQACVWEEGGNEVASISLNGKELICFKAESGSGLAAEKAEDLAARIEEVLTDKHVDASELLPAKNGTMAALQCSGTTVLSFDPDLAVIDCQDAQSLCAEAGLKVVNAIRSALGAPTLPQTFLKLSDRDAQATASGGQCFSGRASWYGGKFHGRRTSDGSRYDQEKLTAAHRSLPFGTKLLVMNRKTGSSCVVEINDRGPFVGDRVIDLSRAAARQLNMLSSGVALVDCLVLGNE